MSQSCCRGVLRTSPGEHHAGCHSEGSFRNYLGPQAFPRGLVCTVGSVWSCCTAGRTRFPIPTVGSREKSRKPPPSHTKVRGRSHEKDPVGELLSEHCFARKMLYESCGCPGERLGAPLVSQGCFAGVLPLSRVIAIRAVMQTRLRPAFSLQRIFPAMPLRSAVGRKVLHSRLVVFSRKLRNTGRQSQIAPRSPPRKGSFFFFACDPTIRTYESIRS